MREPWEIFFEAWQPIAFPATAAPRRSWTQAEELRLARATAHAASVLMHQLRISLDWSMVNSRILVGQLVETTDQWIEFGTDPGQLRYWLHATWTTERTLHDVEQQRRQATEAILAGSRCGAPRQTAEFEPDPFELHAW